MKLDKGANIYWMRPLRPEVQKSGMDLVLGQKECQGGSRAGFLQQNRLSTGNAIIYEVECGYQAFLEEGGFWCVCQMARSWNSASICMVAILPLDLCMWRCEVEEWLSGMYLSWSWWSLYFISSQQFLCVCCWVWAWGFSISGLAPLSGNPIPSYQ